MSTEREFDVIVYGATSFVGQIICRYLATLEPSVKWAMAGRSEQKLQTLTAELGDNAAPYFIADAADGDALLQLCQRTKVVLTTVGPYALYGEAMVAACVETGTDYVDLTGEPQWIHAMLERYEAKAKETGSKIVHCCGFDSIPSDLGVYFLQKEAKQRFGDVCQHVSMRVRRLKGGASGGTVASMMNIIDQTKQDPKLRRTLANPYILCPPEHGYKAYQPSVNHGRYDDISKSWIAPFIMAAINTRVVHRSNALLGSQYGDRFVYEEAMMTGTSFKGAWRAFVMTIGLAGFMFASSIGPLRRYLENNVLPKPGEGPSPKAQERGFFDMRFFGKTAKGEELVIKVTGDRDPGYGSTAKMISQAAITLANDESLNDLPGGFYTPASAFKDALFEPLIEKAGLTFSVVEDEQ